jgi:mono/diheme cytochrome c family protein
MWRVNLNVLLVATLVIGFYTAIAHIIPQLESEVPQELNLGTAVTADELVAAGEAVYNGAGGCTACHGLGTRAPNMLSDHAGEGPIGSRCGTRGKDCKTYLYESLTNPGAVVVPGFENIMTDMRRQLSEAQIWAVVAFLESQGGEVTVTGADIPAAAGGSEPAGGPAPSATMEPVALLTEKGCVGCHALDGNGPPIGPPFDGMGRRISADRIRKGILDPNAEVAKGFEQFAGTMPAIFGEQLSAAQLEILVQFLASRR